VCGLQNGEEFHLKGEAKHRKKKAEKAMKLMNLWAQPPPAAAQ